MNFDGYSQKEIEAFQAFQEKYSVLNPPPSVARLGWQFYSACITSSAAVIMAALRTAEQFYRAAQLSGNQVLATVEAASVLLAIEGGIVIYSAIHAHQTKSIGLEKIKWGIGLMVLISTFAGLGQSLNLVQSLDPGFKVWFQYALSFVIGIGASLVAWIGGEVLGGQIALASDETLRVRSDYQERMYKDWMNSKERRIARAELVADDDAVRSERSIRTAFVRSPNTDRTSHLRNAGSTEQKDRIKEYLAHTFNSEGRIPGPSEVSRELGTSKSYASDVIREWQQENSEAL